MPPTDSIPVDDLLVRAPARSNPARYLYVAAAVLLLVFSLLGFQQFYLRGQAYPAHPIAPPVKALVIAHGVAMTGWVLLFLVQTLLIAGGNRRLHMALGKIGAVLAASMVYLGLRLPIATTRFEPDVVLWGLHRKQFMTVPMFSILLFGVFVAIGIWQRRRQEIHRPMMLLASLAIIAAATDRITGFSDFYAATIWGRAFGPFFIALLVGALFLVVKWALTKKFDRWYAAGYAVLVLNSAFIMRLGPSRIWDRIASYLVG